MLLQKMIMNEEVISIASGSVCDIIGAEGICGNLRCQ